MKTANLYANSAAANLGFAVNAEIRSLPAEGGYVSRAAVPTDSERKSPLRRELYHP